MRHLELTKTTQNTPDNQYKTLLVKQEMRLAVVDVTGLVANVLADLVLSALKEKVVEMGWGVGEDGG